jgi:hypothetical protein
MKRDILILVISLALLSVAAIYIYRFFEIGGWLARSF